MYKQSKLWKFLMFSFSKILKHILKFCINYKTNENKLAIWYNRSGKKFLVLHEIPKNNIKSSNPRPFKLFLGLVGLLGSPKIEVSKLKSIYIEVGVEFDFKMGVQNFRIKRRIFFGSAYLILNPTSTKFLLLQI